jgi:tetratricopeptide (TPR) repeat protein
MFKHLLLCLLISSSCLSQEKEEWIDSPKQSWPVIALTNNVSFKNGDSYVHPSFTYAGTGFLINNGNGILAATAKHVMWIAKNKGSRAVELNSALSKWTLRPKGNLTDSAVVDRLLNEDSSEILEGEGSSILERDWLIFSVKKFSPNIHPLKPRYTPIQPGEKVYILSCAYADSTAKVYEGKVLRKLAMDILIERNMKEFLPGSSGSPVIDTNGYLVGVISSGSSDGETGKGVSVAISTEYLLDVLSGKPGLNNPKKDYGEIIFQTVLKDGASEGIQQYKKMAKDPKNYYIYNLRSANKSGLRETGEKLLKLGRVKDAVEILEFNTKIESAFYVNYNTLARAYLAAGNKERAIKNYQTSTTKLPDQNQNEAFKELENLQRSK